MCKVDRINFKYYQKSWRKKLEQHEIRKQWCYNINQWKSAAAENMDCILFQLLLFSVFHFVVNAFFLFSSNSEKEWPQWRVSRTLSNIDDKNFCWISSLLNEIKYAHAYFVLIIQYPMFLVVMRSSAHKSVGFF